MHNEVTQRILWALPQLLHRHGVVLENAERRPQHHGDLAERNALKQLGLLLEFCEIRTRIRADLQTNIHEHLGCVGEVADTSLTRQHLLEAPRSLLNAGLEIRDIIKR